eukprot:TRINITY_DN4671_c0_g1_i5.p1 TRINITY_DN4671_c0_g1~~TRINITY_DN4671_c0_g1_i5.p1  ORF type:complete len:165 (-),score=41.66 TRINITY_DN4671_c0_g1_i5:413-907(-)
MSDSEQPEPPLIEAVCEGKFEEVERTDTAGHSSHTCGSRSLHSQAADVETRLLVEEETAITAAQATMLNSVIRFLERHQPWTPPALPYFGLWGHAITVNWPNHVFTLAVLASGEVRLSVLGEPASLHTQLDQNFEKRLMTLLKGKSDETEAMIKRVFSFGAQCD